MNNALDFTRRLWTRLTSVTMWAYLETQISISAWQNWANIKYLVILLIVEEITRIAHQELVFNGQMKSVLISIEWNYTTTVSLFTFICTEYKFKVFESSVVNQIHIATLFKNFHKFLYENQAINYVCVILPWIMYQ